MQRASGYDVEAKTVAARLAVIQERIAAAAERAGRDPSSITLVGVTKGVPAEVVREAVEAGLLDIGENRVQEARDKVQALSDLSQCRWHLIGYLQRNKVNMAMRLFHVFHSWDRLPLMEAMSRRATEENRVLEGFVQVNIGREASKHGVDPDEVLDFLPRACALPGLRVRGLMAIPPESDDPEEVRPFFRRLRELNDRARDLGIPGFAGDQLSMGMSGDFEVAIEEGATIVRVGRALFGPRA